jgi:hypothetical protein
LWALVLLVTNLLGLLWILLLLLLHQSKKDVAVAAASVAFANIEANLAAVTAVVVTFAVDVTAVDLLLIL